MSYSNAIEAENLNFELRGVARTILVSESSPPNLWAALFTGDPTDAGTGPEIAYTGYARVAIPRATGSWSAPADASGPQRCTNANTVAFPASTGGGSVQATHWGLMTAATGGTLYRHSPLAVPTTIDPGGSAPTFAPGALALSLT